MDKKTSEEKTEENHGGCKDLIQPEWEKKKEEILNPSDYHRYRARYKPSIRINSSKGKYYVQYKNCWNQWDTIGELNPRNLGTAFGIFMDDIRKIEELRWKKTGIEKGALKSEEDEKEFDRASKDWQGKLDKTIEVSTARSARGRKRRKKQMKALRQVMTPEKDLKVPKREEEDQEEEKRNEKN